MSGHVDLVFVVGNELSQLFFLQLNSETEKNSSFRNVDVVGNATWFLQSFTPTGCGNQYFNRFKLSISFSKNK